MHEPTFVVIDVNLERAQQTCGFLSVKGSAYPVREVKGVLEIHKREGHVDAIFLDVDAAGDLQGAVSGLMRVYPAALLYLTGSRIPVSMWGALVETGVRDFLKHPIDMTRINKLTGFDFQSRSMYESGPFGSDAISAAPVAPGAVSPIMAAPAARRQLEDKPVYGKVICITSPKGGEGRTTLTIHLAMNYAKYGPVAVIDADAQGDIANALKLDIAHTISEVEDAKSEKAYLDTLLAVHEETGIRVLPSPVGEHMNHITRKQLEKAITEYRRFYPVILVDLPQGFLPLHRTALDFATQFISVITPDPKRYQRVEEYVRKLRAEGGEPGVSAVQFVLNYNKPFSKLDDRPIRALLQDYKLLSLPYDRSLLQKTVGGKLLKASRDLMEQVEVLQRKPMKMKWRKKRA